MRLHGVTHKRVALGLIGTALVAAILLGGLGLRLASGDRDDRISPERQAVFDREDAERAKALTEPIPSPFGEDSPIVRHLEDLLALSQASPVPDAIVRRPAGAGIIVENGQAPLAGQFYHGENSWYETKGGQKIVVYAGSTRDEPPRGVLVVHVDTVDGKIVSDAGGSYLAPYGAGALRIVSAEGEVLTLQAADGAKLLFDVASRRFLSPETGEPLATPQPPTPSPTPKTGRYGSSAGAIATVGIDAGSLANSATSLGAREACSKLALGDTVTIDITVDGVPAVLGEDGGGIIGFQFTLVYDPSKVKVIASDTKMLLAANEGSSAVSLGDTTPDADGSFVVAVADFSASSKAVESGSGVLARITLEGVGAGVSALTLEGFSGVNAPAPTGVKLVDAANNVYAVDNVLSAQVAVDAPCP